MNCDSYKKIIFYFFLFAGQIFSLRGFAQEYCDFWGTGRYLDRMVDLGDAVDAYDSGGQFLASAYVVSGGYYSIHVPGDDPSTTEKDGAVANESILFKINGDSALVISGDNHWVKGPQRCDLHVPLGPPRAKPGGPYHGAEGSEVEFDGSLSTGVPESFVWNFGDGNTGGGVSPVHTYLDDGTYTVSLTVTNDSGKVDTKSTTAIISNVAPSVQAGGNMTADEGSVVTFHGSSFDPGVQDIPVYTWDFGDGESGAGKDASHVYRDNSTYIARLTVDDGDEGVGVDSLAVVVSNLPPVANAGGPYDGIVDQPVQFSGSAIDPGSADTFTYQWDLDDDGEYDDSDIQYPQKTYTSVGTYRVCLRVTDDDLAQDTSHAVVRIEQGIAVAFQSEPKAGFQIVIDNQTYTTPVTLYLVPDSLYLVEALEYQSGPTGIRYQFNSWSSGQPRIHTLTGPSEQQTYTLHYRTQYRVDIGDGDIATQITGEGWYYVGDRVDIGIDDSVLDTHGTTRYLFQGWIGYGENAYTGPDNPASFIIADEPVTERAQWKIQYYLALNSSENRGNPQIQGWYDERSWVTFSVASVVQVSSEERFVFDRWHSSDEYGYRGTDQSPSLIMLGPVTEEALWHHQYAFSAQGDPVGGGTITPSEGWANANEFIPLTAVGNGSGGYVFSHWNGDGNGSDNPLNLLLDGPKQVIGHFVQGQGSVTIRTEPEGLNVIVNGNSYVAPLNFDWPPNSVQTLAVAESQGDSSAGTINTYDRWSDGGNRVHEITVGDTPVTYTAYFQTAHFLDIVSDYDNPSGEGWYVQDAMATITVNSPVETGNLERQQFAGWIGTGKGSVTNSVRTQEIQVKGPIQQRVQWSPQFGIQVGHTPSHVSAFSIEMNPPGTWYDLGTQVQLSAFSNDTIYTFISWSGDLVSTNPVIQVTVNGPTVLTANFYTPQQPPTVQNLPDLTLIEDGMFEQSFEWLGNYVNDPSDPIKLLKFSFEGAPHVYGEVDTLNEKYRITLAPDWWGSEDVILRVSDPFEWFDVDTFKVTVLSQDDPPRPFQLLSPPDDTTYSEGEWAIRFVWECSENVDVNDSISYNFYLSPDAQFDHPVVIVESQRDTSLLINMPVSGEYWWRVVAKDVKGLLDDVVKCDRDFKIRVLSGVASDPDHLPKTYGLSQNFPNPFNPETVIQYQLPKPGKVCLSVYNVCGRCVRTLVNGPVRAGYHEVVWDGKDCCGNRVASGIYLFGIRVNDFVSERKMILLR